MTDKTPDDVIQHAAKIIRDANGSGWQRYETAAHDLADAGLLRTAQDDLDLWDAKRIKAERDELRATVEKVREIHQQHACTGYPDCMILFGGQCAHHGHCNHCRKTWPCPTIDALDGVGEQ